VSDAASPNGRIVLVTGAATGIGRACALHLASVGFRVAAAVYPDAFEQTDGRDLEQASAGAITTLPLDVTDRASIAAAAERFETAFPGCALHGLVNNAGISVAGPLEVVPIDDMRRQLEVNVLGPIAVTQAFLPALRKARGRIVNIASVQGRLTLPLAGAYCASKSALLTLTEALRMELAPWGIDVCAVEPGYIATRMAEKAAATWDERNGRDASDARELYGAVAGNARSLVESVGRFGSRPEVVARAVAHALASERPKTRYLVGRGAVAQALLARHVPDRIRDALIARAFATLARVRPAAGGGGRS
jgi:NAD(P)-dependent dehydrogenase (short-subunit alcohol dehydrogenase family)